MTGRYEGQAALMRYSKRKAKEASINAFADLLANEVSPPQAAQRLGYKPSWGRSTLGLIRRQLGPQAV